MDFSVTLHVESNLDFIFQNLGVPNTIIEIGTYEGRTLLYIAENYAKYNSKLRLVAIDPHMGSTDQTDTTLYLAPNTIQEHFQHNLAVAKFKGFQIDYIRKSSTQGLIDLINDKICAELIYIDGDHRADPVLTDLVLGFQVLAPGGVMLCDDFAWKFIDKNNFPAVQLSPRMAIENFIQCNWQNIEVIALPRANQTAFRKLH